ncbi:MAG: NPCBM/NEW2 domain-containing protein [Planctomycetia bacterium]|nr:NPCBM/NEW2 domain-containing protein [Planctomycetia bacterium]
MRYYPLFLCFCFWACQAGAEDFVIQNQFVKVEYDLHDGELELDDLAEARVVAKSVTQDKDALFLKGIEISPDVEGTLKIWIEPNAPWVCFRWELAAKNDDAQLARLDAPLFRLDDDWRPDEMKALGTAGLSNVDEHSGSYMFLAIAKPRVRSGVVAGWISAEVGSGIVKSGRDNEHVLLEMFEEFGSLKIRKGETRLSDWFVIGKFDDARLGLEAYAECVAKFFEIEMKPAPSGYCTWYSDKNRGAGSAETTEEFALCAAKKLVPYGMNFFQIDDKWQCGASRNGPNKNFMAHRPDGPYPNGMKPTAETLNQCGLTAGLWFMPFSGNYNDPYYADKQDWFVKSAIDYPTPGEKNTRRYNNVSQKKNAPYETFWGGTALDFTNPAVVDYVQREVDQIANDWGYKYFKIDGTWVAMAIEQLYVNDAYLPDDIGLQIFHDPSLTNVEVFRKALKLVRDTAGDEVFIMSCNISQNMRSMGGAYGLVDAMRVGPDNGSTWKGICAGPIRGSARYFFNGRVWWNDPDPVYVRDSIPLSHARLSTTWAAMSGQLFAFSDWLPDLSDERVEVLRRTLQNHKSLNVRPVDLFESPLANIWLLSEDATADSPERNIVAIFNWSDTEPLKINEDLRFIGLNPGKEYAVYDFWNKRFLPVVKDRLEVDVPPGSCAVFSLRALEEHPMLVSSSRHVASPILEVEKEVWNSEERELLGVSQVVLNDPYELAIYVPSGLRLLRVDVENLAKDAPEVQSWSIQYWGNVAVLRFTLASEEMPKVAPMPLVGSKENEALFSRKVQWRITFEPASTESAKLSFSPDFDLDSRAWYDGAHLSWSPIHSFGFVLERREITQTNPDDSNLVVRRIADTNFEDTTAQLGKKYEYRIRLLDFNGDASEDFRTVEVQMPEPLILPQENPKPDLALEKMQPLSQKTAWGSVQTNRSCAGNPLSLGGKKFEEGVGIHASGLLVYEIPDGAKKFVATVGLDDFHMKDNRRSAIVRVYVDTKKEGEAPILLVASPLLSNGTIAMWRFNAEIPEGARELRLEVDDADDGIACDHVDIVEAGFLR